MANFTMPPPEFFFQLGGGILSGQNIADGLGRGLTNASPVLAAQREQQQAAQQKDMTYKALMQIDPQKAEMFRAGVLTGPQAYATFAEEKAKREAASRPDYEWKVINDKLVRIDKNAASSPVQEMGDYSTPKELDPTTIQRDLQAAGLQPGTPEYQRAILEHYKKNGMMIETAPDGTMRFVQGNVDTTKMPKLTEAEGKNAGFLKRALTAEKELSALETEGTSMWNKAAGNLPMGTGNYLVSANAQKFNQAKRNFINAVLRRESGAVISPSEFENAEQQYFPQPGDDPQVIAQKRKNREDAIKGFEIGSGPAADRVKQMDEAPQSTDAIPAEDYFK